MVPRTLIQVSENGVRDLVPTGATLLVGLPPRIYRTTNGC